MAQDIRTGKDAYGDWHSDAPGVMRKITAADVQVPVDATGVANRSKIVPKSDNAQLATLEGFSVAPFASQMTGARILRIAPNGDIFVAQSRPQGKVSVLRPSKDGSKVEQSSVFAEGMKVPYGIAFYPSGPKPKWVYLAMEGKIVRFSYQMGDMKASAAPQIIVDDLIVGPSHWTRDIAFSPDGRLMYVAVGSGSNVATDTLGSRPTDLAAFEKSHAVDRHGVKKNIAPMC